MTTGKRLVCAGLAGLVISMAVPACSRSTTPRRADAADPIPVNVATVAMADVPGTFEAGGVVQARTTATLMSRIVAPVREVRAAPGDRVRAPSINAPAQDDNDRDHDCHRRDPGAAIHLRPFDNPLFLAAIPLFALRSRPP